MKKAFSFDLGNRSLLQEEIRLIHQHNQILQRSANRNNRILNDHAFITVKIETVGEHRIVRAASKGKEPKVLPLAGSRLSAQHVKR